MKNNKIISIREKDLKNLLVQAYEEGWCGSKDLAESSANNIFNEFKNKKKEKSLKPKNKSVCSDTGDNFWRSIFLDAINSGSTNNS